METITMSYGIVNYDYYKGTTITMNPEDIGFKYDGMFFENSKKGLKELVKLVFNNYYPVLEMVKTRNLSEEENEEMKKRYHDALKRVVWTDYPDLRHVPDYNERAKTCSSCRTFKKLRVDRKNSYLGDTIVNREVKREIDDFIKDIGKNIIINSVDLIQTHYVAANENFARINYTIIDDVKSLKKLRDEKIIAEKKAEEERIKAEEAKKAKEAEERQVIINQLNNTKYGEYIKSHNLSYSCSIFSDFKKGLISEKFLNATNIDDLFTLDQIKNKDYQRIYGILEKSLKKINFDKDVPLIVRIHQGKAIQLAENMNAKIKGEEKRNARKAAAFDIGAGFIGEFFK